MPRGIKVADYNSVKVHIYVEFIYIFKATMGQLLHLNTAINVLIYAGRLKEFRDAFQADLDWLPCKRFRNPP